MTEDLDNLTLQVAKDGWENRRAIAWISFMVGTLYPFITFAAWIYDKEAAQVLIDLAVPLYSLIGINMTAYYTMSSWENVKGVGDA